MQREQRTLAAATSTAFAAMWMAAEFDGCRYHGQVVVHHDRRESGFGTHAVETQRSREDQDGNEGRVSRHALSDDPVCAASHGLAQPDTYRTRMTDDGVRSAAESRRPARTRSLCATLVSVEPSEVEALIAYCIKTTRDYEPNDTRRRIARSMRGDLSRSRRGCNAARRAHQR